jgi:hypothetical protein
MAWRSRLPGGWSNAQRASIIGIQLKQLADKALGDFSGQQIHLVQSTKQSQQIEPGPFQTRPEVSRDFRRGTASHSPSMAHRGAEVNSDKVARGAMGGREV